MVRTFRLTATAVIVLLAASSGFAQSRTVTADCWSAQLYSGCYLNSGRGTGWTDDWTGLGIEYQVPPQQNCNFQSTLPLGTTVTRIEANAYLADAYAFDQVPTVTLTLNGHVLGSQVVNYGRMSCGNGAFMTYVFDTGEYAGGIPFYQPAGSNTITIDSTASYAIEAVDLVVDYIGIPPVTFDLNATTPETQRRVLLSNGGRSTLEYPYFSTAQTQDGVIKIKGQAKAGTPILTPIYLKIEDPPDSAPYAVAALDAYKNDNKGTAGRLSSGTAYVLADGSFEADLLVTNLGLNAASGDNYQIVASFDDRLVADSAFVCNTETCAKSGVITVWKRLFLETDKMFRHGSFLARRVAPDATRIAVTDRGQLGRISRGTRIRMIHAPRLDGVGSSDYYTKELLVDGVDRNTGDLLLEQAPTNPSWNKPDREYYEAETGTAGALLADAVGVVSGDDATDFWTPYTSLLNALYNDAFVDYKLLSTDPLPYLPSVPVMPNSTQPYTELRVVSEKYFYNEGSPNHQHLMGGASSTQSQLPDGPEAGGTFFADGMSISWIWIDYLRTLTKASRLQNLNGEIVVHELTHQFHVNHCTGQHSWNAASQICPMTSPLDPSDNDWSDGVVAFHYIVASPSDSEYREIRRWTDPLPVWDWPSSY